MIRKKLEGAPLFYFMSSIYLLYFIFRLILFNLFIFFLNLIVFILTLFYFYVILFLPIYYLFINLPIFLFNTSRAKCWFKKLEAQNYNFEVSF